MGLYNGIKSIKHGKFFTLDYNEFSVKVRFEKIYRNLLHGYY
jgi:hypothetical protein